MIYYIFNIELLLYHQVELIEAARENYRIRETFNQTVIE